MTAPASFRELAKAQARVERALEGLSRADARRVLEAVLCSEVASPVPTVPPMLPLPTPAPQCEYTHADNRCVLYADHFGAHDLAQEDRR